MPVVGTGVLGAGGCPAPRKPLGALPCASSPNPAAGLMVTLLFGCQLAEIIYFYPCCVKMPRKEQHSSSQAPFLRSVGRWGWHPMGSRSSGLEAQPEQQVFGNRGED